MKAGDPWDTEERDELRAAQRRILRLIPDWIVERVKVDSSKERTADPLLEHVLRAQVRTLTRQESDRVALLTSHTLTAALSRAIQDEGGFGTGPNRIEGLVSEAQQAARDAEIGDLTKHDGLAELTALLLTLLIAADFHADDGYEDPRRQQSRTG